MAVGSGEGLCQWRQRVPNIGGYQGIIITEAPKVQRSRRLGVEGKGNGRGYPPPEGVSPSPVDYGVWGSVVSSPSRVRGGAPAENGFLRIRTLNEGF